MERKTVCFTGHRPKTIPILNDHKSEGFIKLKARIRKILVDLIEKENAVHYISGMALGIDILCAELVLELKEHYPRITLECALPCETQAAYWSEDNRDRYFSAIERCDKESLLQTRYTKDCFMKRNKYMINKSDIVLSVWNGEKSGTGYTVNYAKQQGKKIILLDPQ